MTLEGQRTGRRMRYLTPRVASPPRLLLVVASLRRVPAHNYNKTYTQNSAKLRSKARTVPILYR
jgi:hypothetical protein